MQIQNLNLCLKKSSLLTNCVTLKNLLRLFMPQLLHCKLNKLTIMCPIVANIYRALTLDQDYVKHFISFSTRNPHNLWVVVPVLQIRKSSPRNFNKHI